MYRQCVVCDHLFSEIVPSEKFLSSYYVGENSGQVEAYVNLSPTQHVNREEEIGHPKVDYANGLISSDNLPSASSKLNWVDVGAGTGDVLVAAEKLGYEALGFEPDPKQAELARRRGCSVVEQFLDEHQPVPREIVSADVLSMLNLLEHLPNPLAFLTALTAEMKFGSWIIIEVPRHPSLSSVIQLSGAYSVHRHINPPEHLHIFSDKSIELMLRKIGFAIVSRWRFGSDALEAYSAIGEVLGWTSGFSDEKLGRSVNELQARIDAFGLSDNMLVIGRRGGRSIIE